MIRQVEQDIRTRGILKFGDRITVGLSGGADSVCLLLLLLDLSEELGLSVSAAHINHGLRAGAADADEAFVRRLCERLCVPLFVYRADVGAFAKEHGLSKEEAGRIIRYEVLKERAGSGKIATAHHADDNAETILYNIMRGTGLAGLAGIPQVNGNIVRPLLNVTRRQIEEELVSRGEKWCTDETNLSGEYTRNRIRNELIPWIERNINPAAREHLLNLAKRADEANVLIEAEARQWLDKEAQMDREARLPLNSFRSLPSPVQKKVLLFAIERLTGRRQDITARHLDAAAALADKKAGMKNSLPYGLKVIREYDSLWLGPDIAGKAEELSVKVRFFERKKEMTPPTKKYTKWFDCDKIKCCLAWRLRQTGDVIEISAGQKKTLARYMIDEKIPARLRDTIPVLADGSEIVWVAGYRISEGYKITDETVHIAEVQLRFDREETEDE